jgi:hypothetical protein
MSTISNIGRNTTDAVPGETLNAYYNAPDILAVLGQHGSVTLPKAERRDNWQASMTGLFSAFASVEQMLSDAANASVAYAADINRNSSRSGDPDNTQPLFYTTRAGIMCVLWKRLARAPHGGLFGNLHRRRMARGRNRERMQIYQKMMEHLQTSLSSHQESRMQSRARYFQASRPDGDRFAAWRLAFEAAQTFRALEQAHADQEAGFVSPDGRCPA